MVHFLTLNKQAEKVKQASFELAITSFDMRNKSLIDIANGLESNIESILTANKIDLKNAGENDRLKLNYHRIIDIANAVRQITTLPDVLGESIGLQRPNGLEINKFSVPLGVVGMIYESRPNVTIDSAVLCLRTGNACLLRGGKEAINTNKEIVRIIKAALKKVGLNENCVELVTDTSRETAIQMMKLNEYLDVIIPRGGAGLIKSVRENATVPVIETGAGNCHIYVDEFANLDMALNILLNAKTQRPSVCNSCETLLVHEKISGKFLPKAFSGLKNKNVEIRYPATDKDLQTEFNDLILAVKEVNSLENAVNHINKYGTKHSESIITDNYENAKRFQKLVDSACVYHNASTRFSDGSEFGFGAEIGISTQKIHARGPMSLRELTTYKYIINGDGQTRV